MAVKIRLTRVGRHKDPLYRIVVCDSRSARDGRFIEQIGTYEPLKGIDGATIDETKAISWLNNGAMPSDTLKAILSKKGILTKFADAKAADKKAKKAE